MILVDYRCKTCGVQMEAIVRSPIPAGRECECGGTMARRFGLGGLVGAATPPSASADLSCSANRNIPGFCHIGPSAKRRAHAAWTGDDTTYERETARQKQRYEQLGPRPVTEAVSHVHSAPQAAASSPRRATE